MSKDYVYKKKKRKSRKAKAANGFFTKLAMVTLLLCCGFLAALFYLQQKSQVYSESKTAKQQEAQASATKKGSGHKGDKNVAEQKLPAPRFEFYTLLPKMNVPTSSKTSEKDSATKTAPQQTTVIDTTQGEEGIKNATATDKSHQVLAENQSGVNNEENIVKQIEKSLPKNETSAEAAQSTTTHVDKTKKTLVPQEQKVAAQYIVQMGMFKSRGDADGLKAELLMLGFDVAVQKLSREGAQWFQVRLGPFKSAAAAESVRKKLIANNYHGMVKPLG